MENFSDKENSDTFSRCTSSEKGAESFSTITHILEDTVLERTLTGNFLLISISGKHPYGLYLFLKSICVEQPLA
jgi:hypothetical protein